MRYSKVTSLLLAAVVAGSSMSVQAFAAHSEAPAQYEKLYSITSPYAQVDWDSFGQYKADFHAHSTNSDGGVLTRDTVEDHYAKGYDILSMTDHNYLTTRWSETDKGAMDAEREEEIVAGVGRDGRGMLDIYEADEQSVVDHINSFFANFNNTAGATMAKTIAAVQDAGGITHINHPGRYTGGKKGGEDGIAASNNPATVKKYVDLFMAYDSCVGMEIINKIDNESRCDRILWDNILQQTMPKGRFVWGFSNDDTHSLNATGYSFNMMLLPELSQEETRNAMETGAFYAVSRVSRLDGINANLPDGRVMPSSGNDDTLYLLEQTTPSITDIEVDEKENAITITGDNYDKIEWIADGQVIATGETLDLNDYEDEIGSYVRAQLKSETGIAFTQPFGVEERDPEKLELTAVSSQNRQATIQFDVASANGKGYVVFLSDSGEEGTFLPYTNVNYNAKGAHIKGLTNGHTYYAYVAFVQDNAITQVSQTVVLTPGK